MNDDDYPDDDGTEEADGLALVRRPEGAILEARRVAAADESDDDADNAIGSFDLDYTPRPNLHFFLRVVEASSGEPLERHRFEVLPEPGMAGKLALAQVRKLNERGREFYDVGAIMFFFQAVMPDIDYQRLLFQMERKDGKRITDDQLLAAGGAVIERYGMGDMSNVVGSEPRRPTQPSPPLRGDSLPSGRSSKARRR